MWLDKCGAYKIKTVRYDTETITYLGPKIWSIAPDEIKDLHHWKYSIKRLSYGNQIVIHVEFVKIHFKSWLC